MKTSISWGLGLLVLSVINLPTTIAATTDVPVAITFDFSSAFNASDGQGHSSALKLWTQGPVFFRLGQKVQVVSTDRNGKILASTAIPVSGKPAQFVAVPRDGALWAGNYDPTNHVTSLTEYDGSGQTLQTVQIPGAIRKLAAIDSSLILLTSKTVTLGHVVGTAFTVDSQVNVSTPFTTIPVALSSSTVALVDQATGAFQLIDFTAHTQRSIGVTSPELDRSKASAQQQHPAFQGGTKGWTVVPVVIGAATDNAGSLYLLLAEIFSGEGARVLKVNVGGAVTGTYMCRTQSGVFPMHIGVSGQDLYLADSTGKGARFTLK
jgi:hypothetical protein